ncbi:hypothetical protein BR93DRAFT_965671 [Coniochaeta sp. PMI_546]|nr:hypothetical protein BR93DRAFT_965671 [Coniochaeta sp. PMI_546]
MASSRAPAPAPLYIEKNRSPSSPSKMSPDYFTETTPVAPSLHNRTSSTSSSDSSCSHSTGTRKPSSPRNVYTHCGRHTDQYLFGGRGFTDMWKAITKKE